MKTPSLRPLLAAALAGILAAAPVSPAFAQEPTPAPAQPPAKGAVPISLGVSKYDYTHSPKAFPNIFAPYTNTYVEPGVLANSPRLEQLIHEGKLGGWIQLWHARQHRRGIDGQPSRALLRPDPEPDDFGRGRDHTHQQPVHLRYCGHGYQQRCCYGRGPR